MKAHLLLSMIFLSSCSILGTNKKISLTGEATYLQREEGGEFIMNRTRGFDKSKNYVVKKRVISKKDEKELEKVVTLSRIVKLKNRINILYPYKSQMQIYMNGKKYSTKLTFDYKSRVLENHMISPEAQWNGVKTYTLPKGNGNYCFYSNIIECASVNGFIEQAIKKQAGKMNLYLIWDGHPYFQEQFINIPDTPFDVAALVYDGKNRKGQFRFSLEAGGQTQFFIINKDRRIERHDWPSQNFSSVVRSF